MEDYGHGPSRSGRKVCAGVILFAFAFLGAGCSAMQDYFKTDRHRFLAPDKVIRPPITGSPINPIYSSISSADTAQELVPNATFPREEDLEYSDADYVLGPSDVVNISILDLFYEGVETPLQREVSASGFITLPLIDKKILAEGLSVDQLREEIIRAYRPDWLKNPIVSVTIAARRKSLYSVMGAVSAPGRYPLVRKDFRLLEALSAAGGVTQTNISYIYVIRQSPAVRQRGAPAEKDKAAAALPGPVELPELPAEAPPEADSAAPEVAPPSAEEDVRIAPPEQPSGPIDVEKALRELGTVLEPKDQVDQQPATAPAEEPGPSNPSEFPQTVPSPSVVTSAPREQEVEALTQKRSSKFIYTSEGWVRVDQAADVATRPSGQGAAPVRPAGRRAQAAPADQQADPFGWRLMDKSSLSRIIAINLNKLKAGDWRQNIIIRENDIIRVPNHELSEFYVMGEVLRPGPYNLTARRLTVKQAITAAGGFAPLAWPKNAVLFRRVGSNQEQIIPLDLEAIFAGEEPDTFLKPDDILAVGTNARASFYAVIRNAFRMTYGFGFIYDRNFADPFTLSLDSKRFTRW